MFGTPIITTYGTPPVTGEVVGADPWDDDSDATYARGSVGGDFHHITAAIDPTVLSAEGLVVTFRVSASLLTAVTMRFVANLYPSGWASGDSGTPPLNFTVGASPVYVLIPVADGEPQDITVAIYDWNTETPATAAQIESYFAAGGTLLIQPSTLGGGSGVVTVHKITVGGVEVVTYRRTFPRDDGLAGGAPRNFPPSKGAQSSNRTSGGYL